MMTFTIEELRRLEAEQVQEKVARHLCKLMDDEWRLGRKLYMDTAKEILDDIALPELLKALEWQPIETAPKDMTEIIVLCGQKDIRLGWYFAPSSRTSGWFDQRQNKINPTHWMPLPLPPHGGVDVG